ncbi:hypothetical protein FRB99_005979, partial [Tulasnella sp. 403]
MLKVFSRKKAPPPPPPPKSVSAPIAPAPRLPVSPALRSDFIPPPLYARFATRGDSFDSASLRSSSTNPNASGLKSSDDLRNADTRTVSSGASRVYGSDTRFNNGLGVPANGSSRRDSKHSTAADEPAVIKKKPPTSRSNSSRNEGISEPSPLRSSVTSRSIVSSPKALGTSNKTRRQSSQYDSDLEPPRPPALYSRSSATSVQTLTPSEGSSSSAFDRPHPQLAFAQPTVLGSNLSASPVDATSPLPEPTPTPPIQPGSPLARSVSRDVEQSEQPTQRQRVLPRPPPAPVPTPVQPTPSPVPTPAPAPAPVATAPAPVKVVQAPVRSSPSAASLVHPAFKRQLPSASHTISASALVHPSQRLRSGSGSATSLPPVVTTVAGPTPPVVNRAANVIATTSQTPSVPAPVPVPAVPTQPVVVPSKEPPVAPPVSAIPAESSTPTPVPARRPLPTIPVAPAISVSPAPQPTPVEPKPVAQPQLPPQSVTPPPPSTTPRPVSPARSIGTPAKQGSTSGSVPPSSHRDVSPVVRALKRRSVEFGTYDIAAARKEREKLGLNGDSLEAPSTPSSLRSRRESLPTTPTTSASGSEALPHRAPSPLALRPIDAAVSKLEAASKASQKSDKPLSREQRRKEQDDRARAAIAAMEEELMGESSARRLAQTITPKAQPAPPPSETGLGLQVNPPLSGSPSSFALPEKAAAESEPSRSRVASEDTITAASVATSRIPVPKDSPVAAPVAASVQSQKPPAAPVEPPQTQGSEDGFPPSKDDLPPPPIEDHPQNASRPLPTPATFTGLHSNRASRRMSASIASQPAAAEKPAEEPSPQETPASPKESIVSAASEEPEEEREPAFYPLAQHLMHPELLAALVKYIGFRDALPLFSLNMTLRRAMEDTREVKEVILERYLSESVGYRQWSNDRMGKRKEPLSLTLRDLNSYMRGISVPPHHYAALADAFLTALAVASSTSPNAPRTPVPKSLTNQVRMMASSTRAYTRVVLRLRAQAEAEEAHLPRVPVPMPSESSLRGRTNMARGQHRMPLTGPGTHPPTTGPVQGLNRRSPSPAFSFTSYDNFGPKSQPTPPIITATPPAVVNAPGRFRSPLFKSGHAPLLRVFVPSPEGAWLSDESVLECERELKRAGVMGLLKIGDVVHDLAAGDEANTGRLIWDGNYLIDLDYSYSPLGEIPKYVDSLAFPPSYFHKIVRTTGNPIVHMDLSPFSADIAKTLQLLQDRVHTETPQGNHHTVVRWVHRARFRIKPNTPVNPSAPPVTTADGTKYIRMIDLQWCGTIVIEAEGTNEGLADLQGRVGNSVMLFPAKNLTGNRLSGDSSHSGSAVVEVLKNPGGGKSVFRLLRGQSRPGEIWL